MLNKKKKKETLKCEIKLKKTCQVLKKKNLMGFFLTQIYNNNYTFTLLVDIASLTIRVTSLRYVCILKIYYKLTKLLKSCYDN